MDSDGPEREGEHSGSNEGKDVPAQKRRTTSACHPFAQKGYLFCIRLGHDIALRCQHYEIEAVLTFDDALEFVVAKAREIVLPVCFEVLFEEGEAGLLVAGAPVALEALSGSICEEDMQQRDGCNGCCQEGIAKGASRIGEEQGIGGNDEGEGDEITPVSLTGLKPR